MIRALPGYWARAEGFPPLILLPALDKWLNFNYSPSFFIKKSIITLPSLDYLLRAEICRATTGAWSTTVLQIHFYFFLSCFVSFLRSFPILEFCTFLGFWVGFFTFLCFFVFLWAQPQSHLCPLPQIVPRVCGAAACKGLWVRWAQGRWRSQWWGHFWPHFGVFQSM